VNRATARFILRSRCAGSKGCAPARRAVNIFEPRRRTRIWSRSPGSASSHRAAVAVGSEFAIRAAARCILRTHPPQEGRQCQSEGLAPQRHSTIHPEILPAAARPALRDRKAVAILCAVSYFGFRSNVARRRAKNSCALEQLWSRTSTSCTKSAQTCTRRRGQVWYRFFQPGWRVFYSVARGACEVKQEFCGEVTETLRLILHPSHETKARRMGHPEIQVRSFGRCVTVDHPPPGDSTAIIWGV